MRRPDMAAAFRRVVEKAQPSASQLHVPAPIGEEKKRRRRRAIAKILRGGGVDPTRFYSDQASWMDEAAALRVSKGEDPGQYVGRMVANADQLRYWWDSVRHDSDPAELDPNPHVTVAYSRKTFPWKPDTTTLVIQPPFTIGVLGAEKAVVVYLESQALESRWNDTRAAGATWDHQGYHPHLTLFYLGAGGDESWRDDTDAPQPDFPLLLGPELVGPRGVDVFEAALAPAWFVPQPR